MGTGVVGFNLAKNTAIMGDTNPYIIEFYKQLNLNELDPCKIRKFLMSEGEKLSVIGDEYYYKVRERFNLYNSPLDFLFLNRSGFNGMIRFNKQGNYNVPYCHKDKRFSKSYITKIVNQVSKVLNKFKLIKFLFLCQDFSKTIELATQNDIIYCDPPYIDRYVDYYNGWNDADEEKLYKLLLNTKSKFILSTWHHNNYRSNDYIVRHWKNFNIITTQHVYYVGAKEKNRNSMVEALITNFEIKIPKKNYKKLQNMQLQLI